MKVCYGSKSWGGGINYSNCWTNQEYVVSIWRVYSRMRRESMTKCMVYGLGFNESKTYWRDTY